MNHSESRLVFAADKFADEIDMDRLKETEYLLLLNDFSLLSSKNIDLMIASID